MENKAICGFVISGISLSPDTDEREACSIAANELKRAGINPARIRFSIYKKSVDARRKNDVRLVYSVAAKFDTPQIIKTPSIKKYRIAELLNGELDIQYGAQVSKYQPLVVGMGPAGLFCALLLAENGYKGIFKIHAIENKFVGAASAESSLKACKLDSKAMFDALK